MFGQGSTRMRMSDQRLMCVWQTVDLLDPNHSAADGTARKNTVQDVTASLSRSCRLVHYSKIGYEDNFPNSVVKFDDYVNYVKVCLRDHSVPFARVEEEFEIQSWEICKESYGLHHCSVMEGEVFKVWQIFNKLCVPGSMPPVIEFDDVQWLGIKFAAASRQRWSALHDGHLTFTEFLNDLDAMCFKNLSHGEVEKAVAGVHSWLVREIIHTGFMNKRTRKQANWTTWQKRWFILKPGLLTYYTNPTLSDKKGDIILNNKSTIDDLSDFKTLLRQYPNRFRITNAPFIEIELSAEDLMSKNQWMTAVGLVIRAAKLGTSPSEVKLSDVRKQYNMEYKPDYGIPNSIQKRLRSDGEEEDEDDIDGARNSAASYDDENNDSGRSSSSEESKMVFSQVIASIEKLKDICQGACDPEDEFNITTFTAFLNDLELELPEEEILALFDLMHGEEEGESVSVDQFVQYLLRLILLEEIPTERAACMFLSAVLKPGSALSKKVGEFEEFVGTVWNRQRVHYVRLLNEVLNGQEGGDEDTLTLIRQAFSREQSVLGTILDCPEAEKAQELILLFSQMKMSPDSLSQYLYLKWEEYPIKGEVERHPNRISQDKSLLDIVFYKDGTPEIPNHKSIHNFRWKRPSAEGKLGMALFPSDFDGNIAVAHTTPEELLYYGASLASQCQINTSLIYHHSLVAFSDKVQSCCASDIKRPACLRYQDEATLLCPLQERSGVLILGKQEGSTLIISGFRIPAFTSVYIPRQTIYCIDYAQGVWRQMTNMRATIVHAQMLQMEEEEEEEENDESNIWPRDAKKCSFAFESYL